MKNKNDNGITLIALIITIIVMLILVGVTVSVAMQGGLFVKARKAVTDTQYEKDKEMLYTSIMGAFNDKAEVDFKKLDESLPDGFEKAEDGGYTSEAGNTFYVDKNGNITDEKVVTPGATGPQITFNGETVTLTPDNVADYLGKVVTNYTGKSSVVIDGKTYKKVSTKYRLYYVDFRNKYGDGEGTVYLKADSTITYSLPLTEPKGTDVVKIENLNPELYKNGNPPDASQNNMKAVKWLTNTNNWEDLKPASYTEGILETDINYIVGAPSLEMMMDSYNTHYELTGNDPDTTTALQDTQNRVKLFYQYPLEGNNNNYGYGVGPSNSNKYGTRTSGYSVKTDSIDSMYFPGSSGCDWLASPSAADARFVMRVSTELGGDVGRDYYSNGGGLCPLVSLKSSVYLTLQ